MVFSLSFFPTHALTRFHCRFGNDGNWSTLTMRIGEPPQVVYLLAGTSSSITTAVGSVWCNDPQSGYNCQARGRSFDPTESTTWDDKGQWVLGIRSDLVNEQQFLQ